MTLPLPDASLDQLFRTARSYNAYLDQPVDVDQINAIWDLMKMGPTSANQLPARLVWCTSPEAKDKLAACTMPANADKIRSAPVTVIVAMDLEFHEQRLFHLPCVHEFFWRRHLHVSLPRWIEPVAVRHPGVKLILAHLGHPYEGECIVAIRKHENVFADVSALHYRPRCRGC